MCQRGNNIISFFEYFTTFIGDEVKTLIAAWFLELVKEVTVINRWNVANINMFWVRDEWEGFIECLEQFRLTNKIENSGIIDINKWVHIWNFKKYLGLG